MISEAAAEITLQPLQALSGARRRDPVLRHPDRAVRDRAESDASSTGEGPRLTPPLVEQRARRADGLPGAARADLRDGRARSKRQLDPAKTLIGFAGSPWTVATYMVAGQGSRDQAEARRLAYADPGAFGAIIDRIEEVTIDYLSRPDRGRRRGACNCSTAGRAACRRRSSSDG